MKEYNIKLYTWDELPKSVQEKIPNDKYFNYQYNIKGIVINQGEYNFLEKIAENPPTEYQRFMKFMTGIDVEDQPKVQEYVPMVYLVRHDFDKPDFINSVTGSLTYVFSTMNKAESFFRQLVYKNRIMDINFFTKETTHTYHHHFLGDVINTCDIYLFNSQIDPPTIN